MNPDNTIIALFNYGGGMRGLIPAHLMTQIEEKTGLRMADMIDIFTGPSTGAILNTALNIPDPDDPGRPKYRAKHMVRFYEQEGAKIFPADSFRSFRGLIHDFNNRTMKIGQLDKLFRHGHYSPKHLSKSLERLYGDSRLSDSLKSLIIPVYNINGDQLKIAKDKGETDDAPVHTLNNFVDEGGHAVWLKNIKFPHNIKPPPDVRLHDAIMASTAAPTYFPCHHFKVKYSDKRSAREYSGIDGSIFDNPCISYHGAIRQHLPKNVNFIMIILGTGFTVRSITKKDWDSFGGLGVVDPVNDLPLIRILFHAPESALVESFSQEMGDRLFVFNKSMIAEKAKPGTPSTQIDDANPVNLRNLESFAHEMIAENQAAFDTLCDILVKNYERKQRPGAFSPKSLLHKILKKSA